MKFGVLVVTSISVFILLFIGLATIAGGFAEVSGVNLGVLGNNTRTYMQTLFFDLSQFLMWPIVMLIFVSLLFAIVVFMVYGR